MDILGDILESVREKYVKKKEEKKMIEREINGMMNYIDKN